MRSDRLFPEIDFNEAIYLIAVILVALIVLPLLVFGPALKKAGFSVFWALLASIPVINVVTRWVFAFVEWPSERA